MKTIGIVAHSAEGGALCFLTACREGQVLLGAHMHPDVVVSAIPMGLGMPGWEGDDYELVARHLRRGVETVAAAGADFFICPDNTAHIVLETIAGSLPIPELHIADVVAHEMAENGYRKAAILGTKWTMTGRVYPEALARRGCWPDTQSARRSARRRWLCRAAGSRRRCTRQRGQSRDSRGRAASVDSGPYGRHPSRVPHPGAP